MAAIRIDVLENGGSTQRILRPGRLDLVRYRRGTRQWLISGVSSRMVGNTAWPSVQPSTEVHRHWPRRIGSRSNR